MWQKKKNNETERFFTLVAAGLAIVVGTHGLLDKQGDGGLVELVKALHVQLNSEVLSKRKKNKR